MSRHPRTLVLLAHPGLAGSRVNRALAEAVAGLPGVTVRDLAGARGENGFDVAAEQRLLIEHDSVVLQFPWHWYSVPALVKEWMDQVLTFGFAYGSHGTALQGKTLQVVTTTGAPEAAYRPEGRNRFTMSELMRPLDATAHLCGLALADPFVVHGARTLDDDTLASYGARYRALLGSEQLPATA
jgi:glutathione-regulated potassium-efflux system ancillary protein KefG